MGATLYWDKYWTSNNFGLRFNYYEADLEEKEVYELETIFEDLKAFNEAVKEMMKSLPEALKYEYEQWKETDKEEKRREAMGYNKTLSDLLEDKNPQIVRLAKGIKGELTK